MTYQENFYEFLNEKSIKYFSMKNNVILSKNSNNNIMRNSDIICDIVFFSRRQVYIFFAETKNQFDTIQLRWYEFFEKKYPMDVYILNDNDLNNLLYETYEKNHQDFPNLKDNIYRRKYMVSFQRFKENINKNNEWEFEIDFIRKEINKIFHEKYKFVKECNKIVSYEDGIKKFETDSLLHMYFIYRKLFLYIDEREEKRENKIGLLNMCKE